MIVPTTTASVLSERALSAALSLGETVVAVAVAGDDEERERILEEWRVWSCAVPIEVLVDPQRSLVRTVLGYIESIEPDDGTLITVLIPEVIPRRRRHEILHNQRGRLLEVALKARTDVVVATLPFHLHEK